MVGKLRMDKNDIIIFSLFVLAAISSMLLAYVNMPSINDKLSNTFGYEDYSVFNDYTIKEYGLNLDSVNYEIFLETVKVNYEYNSYKDSLTNERDIKNCQYYSYLYYNWFNNNGYEVQYVLSEEHIFVIAYIDNGYYVLDGAVQYFVRLE